MLLGDLSKAPIAPAGAAAAPTSAVLHGAQRTKSAELLLPEAPRAGTCTRLMPLPSSCAAKLRWKWALRKPEATAQSGAGVSWGGI